MHCGGISYDQDVISNDAVAYSTINRCWSPLEPMPVPKYGHASHCFDKYVYTLGGKNKKKLNSVHKFNLQTMTWKGSSPMIHGLVHPITTPINICIYVVTNTNPGNPVMADEHGIALQMLNTVTEKWTLKQPMPAEITTTHGASAVSANDMMYVVGGEGKICTQYIPISNCWTVLSQPMFMHMHGCSAYYAGKIVLMGGATSPCLQYPTDVVEEYDQETNTWHKCPVKLPVKMKHGFSLIIEM